MKQNFRNVGLATLTLFSFVTFAQETNKHVKQKELNSNGIPSLITFNESSNIKNSDVTQIFRDQLGLKTQQSLNSISNEIDELGFNHEKFQLFHKGVKVEFATYSLHSKQGKVMSMSGEFYNFGEVSTTPQISAQDAFTMAKNYTGATSYMWENANEAAKINYQIPVGELVFLPIIDAEVKKGDFDNIKLAYKFDIYASNPVSRGDLYIDANTGEVLFYNATIKHLGEHAHGAKTTKQAFSKIIEKPQSFDLFKNSSLLVAANAATRYSGTQQIQTLLSGSSYILSDNTRGGGAQTYNMKKGTNYASAVNFTDVDNNWTAAEFNNTNKDNAALDAHWGAEMTYDYFSVKHARNSYNNAGAKINSYVHYSSNYNNAYWDGSRMTYGDGSGTGGFNALTSLDVAAHEIGHAVCSSTANLAYQKESGAMNEGFSDIWAACVEYYAAPTKQPWLIGEDIEMRSGHVALRSMSNPNAEGQPDTYGGTYWINPSCTPTQTNDYCGVHTNSGVMNHWFYILSIGKSGTNDIGNAFNVTGITIDKAAKIAYRTEVNYLSANSTFANARTGSIQAATDLYGAGSAEVIATTNAWYAVGVGAAYAGSTDTTAPSTPASLVASGTTSSTTNLAWNASTDNVAVTGYNVYRGTTLLGSTTATVRTYSVTGLTASTAYTFSVKAKDAANNLSASSNVVNVTTLAGSAVTYCASTSNSTADEKIGRVVLGTINNPSTGTAGYENFTALSTNLTRGTANTITITPSWTSTVYSEGYAVWIDYNKNGLFTDAGELVYSKATSTATSASGSFTVPTTATVGTTRMRVSMKYNGIPTSCETLSYGQVEDYSVNIVAATAITTLTDFNSNESLTTISLYPNPTKEVLNIETNSLTKLNYSVFNYLGQVVKTGSIENNVLNVSNLNAGIYILEVNDGQKSVTKKFIKE